MRTGEGWALWGSRMGIVMLSLMLSTTLTLGCDEDGGNDPEDTSDVLEDQGDGMVDVPTDQDDTQMDMGMVGGLCDPCERNAQCGGPLDRCVVATVGGEVETFCGRDCSMDARSCPDDYDCLDVGDGVRQCVPTLGTCVDQCADVMCAPGEVCNPADGSCEPTLVLCDLDCTTDEMCGGPDDICVLLQEANESICAQDCSADPTSCPEGYVCANVGTGGLLQQCVPATLTCTDRCSDVMCQPGQVCDPTGPVHLAARAV